MAASLVKLECPEEVDVDDLSTVIASEGYGATTLGRTIFVIKMYPFDPPLEKFFTESFTQMLRNKGIEVVIS